MYIFRIVFVCVSVLFFYSNVYADLSKISEHDMFVLKSTSGTSVLSYTVGKKEGCVKNVYVKERLPKYKVFPRGSLDNDHSYLKIHSLDNVELSLLLKGQLGVENGEFNYLTPGLRRSEPFGILNCPEDIGDPERRNAALTCSYYALVSSGDISCLTALPYRETVDYGLGKYKFSSKIEKKPYQSALIVGYSDKELNSNVKISSSYSFDEKVVVNAIYSLLRAINVQATLRSGHCGYDTYTYFLSDTFSSADSVEMSERNMERRTEVYYFNGEFSAHDLINRAAVLLKKRLPKKSPEWFETVWAHKDSEGNTVGAYKNMSRYEFDNAVYILRKVAAADEVVPLEILLKENDLANCRRNVLKASAGESLLHANSTAMVYN